MTYPISFRRHVLAVKEREGLTFSQAAERFAVGIASLVRWSAKLEPKEYKRGRGLKIDLEMLAQDVRDFPDAYQYERAERFGVTPKAIWQALRKLGVTYKNPSRTQRRTKALGMPFANRLSVSMNKVSPSFTLTKVVLPMTCPERMGNRPRASAASGSKIGMREDVSMSLAHCCQGCCYPLG